MNKFKTKTEEKVDYHYEICSKQEIRFQNNKLYENIESSEEDTIKNNIVYYQSISGLYREKETAVSWSYRIKTTENKKMPSYKLWTTENFYSYIYKFDEQKESAKLERKVDIKKMVQVENPSYQPVSIPDKAEVNGEVCYIVYVANKEAKETNDGYRWFAISFKDDQIKKIFTTRKEYNEQAKILDIDK